MWHSDQNDFNNRKIQYVCWFWSCWSDILLFAMFYCALQTQNINACHVQVADKSKYERNGRWIHSTQYKWKKAVTRASNVSGGLSNIIWKIYHCLFLVDQTLIHVLYWRGHCIDSSHKVKRAMRQRQDVKGGYSKPRSARCSPDAAYFQNWQDKEWQTVHTARRKCKGTQQKVPSWGVLSFKVFLSIWITVQDDTDEEVPLFSIVASCPLCTMCIMFIINTQKTWREKTQLQLYLGYCWYIHIKHVKLVEEVRRTLYNKSRQQAIFSVSF